MDIKKDIPYLAFMAFGNKLNNWVRVYLDLLWIMDNLHKDTIRNTGFIATSIIEALSRYLEDLLLEGNFRKLFVAKDWERYRHRNSLFNPHNVEDLNPSFESWVIKLYSFLNDFINKQSLPSNEIIQNMPIKKKLKVNRIAPQKKISNLAFRLNAYSESYKFMYLDIEDLVHHTILDNTTKSIAIGGVIRSFKGFLNSSIELIHPNSNFSIEKGNRDNPGNNNSENQKKSILLNNTELSEETLEIIFLPNAQNYQHGDYIDSTNNPFNTDWLKTFQDSLELLLNSLDPFYIQAQTTIRSIAAKKKLEKQDYKIIKEYFHSRDLLTLFLKTSKVENLIKDLHQEGFFNFPHKKNNYINYPYNDLYPQSRILCEKATTEPELVVSIICRWPINIDERIISDSLDALSKMPNKFSINALPTVLQWAKKHKQNKFLLGEVVDFLCALSTLTNPNDDFKKIYFNLIRITFLNLMHASQQLINNKIQYGEAPFISSESVEKLAAVAFLNLGNRFLDWLFRICKKMWNESRIVGIWIPNFAQSYRENIFKNYDVLFLLSYCDQKYCAIKKAPNINLAISTLARHKNPIIVRIAYEIILRLLNEQPSTLSTKTLSKFACNTKLFFSSSGVSEYRRFVFSAWKSLLPSAQYTLLQWWKDGFKTHTLKQSNKYMWFKTNNEKIPLELQADYKSFLEEEKKIENEKAQPEWPPSQKESIKKWIEQAQKIISKDVTNYFNSEKNRKNLEALTRNVATRPNGYLKAKEWINADSEIANAILQGINLAQIEQISRGFSAYFLNLKQSLENLAVDKLWPHVNFFLKLSEIYRIPLNDNNQKTFLYLQWKLLKKIINTPISENPVKESQDPLPDRSINSLHGKVLTSILNYSLITTANRAKTLCLLNEGTDLIDCVVVPELAFLVGQLAPYFFTFTPKVAFDLLQIMSNSNNHNTKSVAINLWTGLACTRFQPPQNSLKDLIGGLITFFNPSSDCIIQSLEYKIVLSLCIKIFHWYLTGENDVDDPVFRDFIKASNQDTLIAVVEFLSREVDEDNTKSINKNRLGRFSKILAAIIEFHGTFPLNQLGWALKKGMIIHFIHQLSLALKNGVIVEPIWMVFEALDEYSEHNMHEAAELIILILRMYSGEVLSHGVQQLNNCIVSFENKNLESKRVNTIKGLKAQKIGLS